MRWDEEESVSDSKKSIEVVELVALEVELERKERGRRESEQRPVGTSFIARTRRHLKGEGKRILTASFIPLTCKPNIGAKMARVERRRTQEKEEGGKSKKERRQIFVRSFPSTFREKILA